MRSLIAIGIIVGAAGVAAIVLPWSDDATVERLRDADTLVLIDGRVIRLRGVDAPETSARWAECPEELEAGRAATEAVQWIVGRDVTLVEPDPDQDPYGRIVADVTVGGVNLGQWLIEANFAVPWPHEEGIWCDG